jgi:hypothetical protein
MQLLVSVRSETEVLAAVEGGADIVDVKNPDEGTLGANFPHVIRQARTLTPPGIAVSAAIGDVPNLPGTVALAALGAALCGVQYVKVGLLGPQTHAQAVYLLQQVCRAVRDTCPNTLIIATAYADAPKVKALPPLALPAAAIEAGVDGCMLDTLGKKGGTLLTCLPGDFLRHFVTQCRQAQLLCALAGSLQHPDDLAAACRLGADIIGVRTAACIGDRMTGHIDRYKVQRLKALLAEHACPAAAPLPAESPTGPELRR